MAVFHLVKCVCVVCVIFFLLVFLVVSGEPSWSGVLFTFRGWPRGRECGQGGRIGSCPFTYGNVCQLTIAPGYEGTYWLPFCQCQSCARLRPLSNGAY